MAHLVPPLAITERSSHALGRYARVSERPETHASPRPVRQQFRLHCPLLPQPLLLVVASKPALVVLTIS